MRAALALLLLLAGCSGTGDSVQKGSKSGDLESAAIARGLVRDPKDTEIAGLYARDTDRVCIVPAGSSHRIGVYVDYGERITCSGTGSITRVGESLHIRLGDGDACSFDAHFDGDHIKFPGSLPDGCASFCARRASLAGLEVSRLSETIAEAAAMRDSNGRRLCGQ